MTKYPTGKHPGAVWKYVDLQVHTPRDPDWVGNPHLPGGTEEQEQARREWAENFLATATLFGLNVIAITDHHDVTMVPYLQEVAATEGYEVLPDAPSRGVRVSRP